MERTNGRGIKKRRQTALERPHNGDGSRRHGGGTQAEGGEDGGTAVVCGYRHWRRRWAVPDGRRGHDGAALGHLRGGLLGLRRRSGRFNGWSRSVYRGSGDVGRRGRWSDRARDRGGFGGSLGGGGHEKHCQHHRDKADAIAGDLHSGRGHELENRGKCRRETGLRFTDEEGWRSLEATCI
ncbi:hypothetical protein BHE74_00041623 [Ensete ventricosum]|nr:hypothetical protein GW17_00042307 [Ensete ventricosum]RWW51992.1 hypothetical protein BHE74_00041623 [Ensete ventricosum]